MKTSKITELVQNVEKLAKDNIIDCLFSVLLLMNIPKPLNSKLPK